LPIIFFFLSLSAPPLFSVSVPPANGSDVCIGLTQSQKKITREYFRYEAYVKEIKKWEFDEQKQIKLSRANENEIRQETRKLLEETIY
jgi:hypothetical protein